MVSIDRWSARTDGRFLVAEGPSLYRPRRPERTIFYRLLDDHFTEFARVHEERFESEDGPLRPVVKDAVAAFLDCGVPRGGFARVRCPECKAEYLLCSPAARGSSVRPANRRGPSSSRRGSARTSSPP
jgi:hypothetical protein